MRRQARLLALTEYLRSRRTGVTAEALADRFGVTIRTVYRDLDTLKQAALPVRGERGPGGGYALDRHYTLPPVNFTAREAALLVSLGRWAADARFMPFAGTLDSALQKVTAALSASAQRELLEHVKTLRFLGVPALPARAAVRAAVEAAWFERTALSIAYRRSDGVLTHRQVRILGALMERGSTILLAHDLDKNEPRQFRLDRIESAGETKGR